MNKLCSFCGIKLVRRAKNIHCSRKCYGKSKIGKGEIMIDRFYKLISVKDGCWHWKGAKSEKGYGFFEIRKGVVIKAHRLMWMLCNGEILNGLHILHHCDNPSCVNPGHLWIGTAKDNARDAFEKKRRITTKDFTTGRFVKRLDFEHAN